MVIFGEKLPLTEYGAGGGAYLLICVLDVRICLC